ncbi:MAG: hypothetical protein NTY53_18365 [Kiritimatiellaeota bacterium]|nr:hypothetical protein [Kiritimatiellota bacterium]
METIPSLSLGMLGLFPSPLLLAVLLVLGLLFWGLKNPLAWVILSVLLITAGVGCAIYGVTDLIGLSVSHAPSAIEPSRAIREAATYVGCGAGGAVGGIVLLVVALLRRKKAAGPA